MLQGDCKKEKKTTVKSWASKSHQAENLILADVIWERRICVHGAKGETHRANGTKQRQKV